MEGIPSSPHSLPANATSLDIRELTINTEYNITVYASTASGRGLKASQVRQTDEDGKEE